MPSNSKLCPPELTATTKSPSTASPLEELLELEDEELLELVELEEELLELALELELASAPLEPEDDPELLALPESPPHALTIAAADNTNNKLLRRGKFRIADFIKKSFDRLVIIMIPVDAMDAQDFLTFLSHKYHVYITSLPNFRLTSGG